MESATEEVELRMTAMIDVTFLLLIFFLCSIKFKLLDGKLCTYLPKDRGVNACSMDERLIERMEIRLQRAENAPDGFLIRLNEKTLSGIGELCCKIKSLTAQDPTLKAVCYPGIGIQHVHVVKTLNECLKAGLGSISFGSAAMDE